MSFTFFTLGFSVGVLSAVVYELCCLASNMKREDQFLGGVINAAT